MIGQRVKITVLKTTYLADELGIELPPPPPHPDGADALPPPPDGPMTCPILYEGQEFIYQLGGAGVPEGFCDWAWNDIFKDIMAVCSRAAMVPEDQRRNVEVSYPCCTDGTRPVIFKVEAI